MAQGAPGAGRETWQRWGAEAPHCRGSNTRERLASSLTPLGHLWCCEYLVPTFPPHLCDDKWVFSWAHPSSACCL